MHVETSAKSMTDQDFFSTFREFTSGEFFVEQSIDHLLVIYSADADKKNKSSDLLLSHQAKAFDADPIGFSSSFISLKTEDYTSLFAVADEYWSEYQKTLAYISTIACYCADTSSANSLKSPVTSFGEYTGFIDSAQDSCGSEDNHCKKCGGHLEEGRCKKCSSSAH